MSIKAFIKERGGYIRSKDIDNRAIYAQLLKEVANGNIVRIRNGIYALPEEMAKTMVDVEKIVPGGVLCMYSAWAYYELTSKLPPDICIAIDKKRKIIWLYLQIRKLMSYWINIRHWSRLWKSACRVH
jgi:predicted transcriptional regulator of viral defense system